MPHHIIKEIMPEDTILRVLHNQSTNWSMENYHFHDSYEINLSISGGHRFFINDSLYEAKKGDIFLFNPLDLHKNIIPKGLLYERYLIFFKREALAGISTKETNLLELFENRSSDFVHRRHLSPENNALLVSLMEQLIHHQKQSVYGTDIYLKLLLSELLLLLNKIYAVHEKIGKKELTSHTKIKPILGYINQHIDEVLSLDDLSTTFFINKYYLCELFKKTTGFTINQYILNRRIGLARELLLMDLSVTEVAYKIGFNSDSHFISVFKKLVGVTPKQYALKTDYPN